MGWNTSALFIKRPKQQVIEAVAGMFEPTDATVGWEDAASWRGLDPNLALTGVGLWTVAWCPSWECIMSPSYEALRCALSRGGAVLAMIWSSVASSYGFRYYVDGELAREIMYENGKPDIEHGEAIAAEAHIEVPSWGPDEAWCFTIIERLVPGFDLEAPCQLLKFVSGEPSAWSGETKAKTKSAKPAAKKPVKKPAKKAAKVAKKPAKPAAKKSAKPAKKSAKPGKKRKR